MHWILFFVLTYILYLCFKKEPRSVIILRTYSGGDLKKIFHIYNCLIVNLCRKLTLKQLDKHELLHLEKRERPIGKQECVDRGPSAASLPEILLFSSFYRKEVGLKLVWLETYPYLSIIGVLIFFILFLIRRFLILIASLL